MVKIKKSRQAGIFLFAEREGFAPSSDGAPYRMMWRRDNPPAGRCFGYANFVL